MLTTFTQKRSKASRIFATGLCAVFLTTYIGVFNIEAKSAFAQENPGEPTPQIQANFGTAGSTSTTSTTSATTSVFSGLKGLLFGSSGQANSNGNYTTTSTNYYNNKFGSQTQEQYQTYINQNSGVTGFFKGLFGGSNTYATTTTNTTSYPLTNGYKTGGTTFGNPVNSTSSTVTTSTGTNSYYTIGNTGTTVTYSNQNKIAGRQIGGTVGAFIGGTMDVVSFAGNKVTSAGNVALNNLANAKGAISNGINASTAGLVGTMGKVLGFGGRVIAGAAKAALTIPMLAIKAGVFLTSVAAVGTVKLLGAGLNVLKNVVDTTTVGVSNLSTQVNNLSTNITSNNTTTTAASTNTNFNQNFNNQTFGTNLNNTITYADQLQQNMTTGTGLINTVKVGAQKAMNNFSANTQIAKLSLVEAGRKLAYNTAVLLYGASSTAAVKMAVSINNIEYTKTQLKSLKTMNQNGTLNPYLFKQYLTQIKTQLDQAQANLNSSTTTINSAYLMTLSNINGTRNYINQNSTQITNQMNQFGSYNPYIQTNQTNYSQLTQLNQYNTGLTTLNNNYATIQNSNNFGSSNSSNTVSTTSTVGTTIKSLLGFNQASDAERQINADTAATVENSNQLAAETIQSQKIVTSAAGENAGSKAAYDKYMAAYNKYTTMLAEDSNNSSEIDKALEEYKTAYDDYQNAYQKSLMSVNK